MVTDSDGYQWYMRTYVDKSRLNDFKTRCLKNTYFIYGSYAGYSGVTNRAMMDVEKFVDVAGNVIGCYEFYN